MLLKFIFLYCALFLTNIQMINANYSNNTINPEKISDEVFRFYKSARSRSDRDGRRLISFNTRNDNIEVDFIVF